MSFCRFTPRPAPENARRARRRPAGFARVVRSLLVGTLLLQGGCGEPDADPDPGTGATAAATIEDSFDGGTIGSPDGPGRDSPSVDSPVLDNPDTADPTESSTDDPPANDPTSGLGPGLGLELDSNIAGSDELVADAAPADCADTLPCRRTVFDGALAVTLHAADGDALDGSGPPRIDVVLEMLARDAIVALGNTSSIVAGGQVLEANALRLGLASDPGARDEAAFPLVAGVPINGHATFAGSLIGNPERLDRVTLRLVEAGLATRATFANVPFGAERSAPVDCANVLPCEWRPADVGTALTLTDAAPLRWNRATRLVVAFSLASTRPLELALLPGGRVANGAGETLEPYGIELGGVESRDGTPIVHELGANESVAGRLVPRRAPEEDETSLARVGIALVERRSPRTPRWRPVFLNVPLHDSPPDE